MKSTFIVFSFATYLFSSSFSQAIGISKKYEGNASPGQCSVDESTGCWGNSCATFNASARRTLAAIKNCATDASAAADLLWQMNQTSHNEGYITESDRGLRKAKKANYNQTVDVLGAFEWGAAEKSKDIIERVQSIRLKAAVAEAKARGERYSRSDIEAKLNTEMEIELGLKYRNYGPGNAALKKYIDKYSAGDAKIQTRFEDFQRRSLEWCQNSFPQAAANAVSFNSAFWVSNLIPGDPRPNMYCIDRAPGRRQQDVATIQKAYAQFQREAAQTGVQIPSSTTPAIAKTQERYLEEPAAAGAQDSQSNVATGTHGPAAPNAHATETKTRPAFRDRKGLLPWIIRKINPDDSDAATSSAEEPAETTRRPIPDYPRR